MLTSASQLSWRSIPSPPTPWTRFTGSVAAQNVAAIPAHARSYYEKAIERFPQTYFAHAAATTAEQLGPGEENPVGCPGENSGCPPPLRPFDEPFPPTAADRWAKAQALRIIAFDASAELELKNAYFATSSPRFLLEAAQAAFDQGHFAAGMAYARIIFPALNHDKSPMRPSRCGRLFTRSRMKPRCAAKLRGTISIPCSRPV